MSIHVGSCFEGVKLFSVVPIFLEFYRNALYILWQLFNCLTATRFLRADYISMARFTAWGNEFCKHTNKNIREHNILSPILSKDMYLSRSRNGEQDKVVYLKIANRKTTSLILF